MAAITVVVPVYKVELYIHQCVNSLLGQSLSDFCLILVDDGSPDECGKICETYAQKDNRVVVIHQQNGGLSAARNAGIEWALQKKESEWITFVDSDDWVAPDYLEKLFFAAKKFETNIAVGGFQKTEGEALLPCDVPYYADTPEHFWCENRINATVAWGKLYRLDLFEQVRYPVGKLNEDEFTTYQLLFSQKRIAVSSEKLYAYRINPKGIMKSKWTEKKLDFIAAFQEQFAFFEQEGYEKALHQSATDFLFILVYAWYDLKRSGENDSCKKVIHRELRNRKRWYHRVLRMRVSENKELYRLLYPYRMWLVERIGWIK